MLPYLGKLMIFLGLFLVVLGIAFLVGAKIPWLGRLPGDIHYTSPKGNFTFYFPIVTCLIISLILTLLLRLFWK